MANEVVGEVGEIAVEFPDPIVMRGYLRDLEATAAVLSDDLLRTGDIDRRATDGTITHLGRIDELFLSAGYRVSPLEAEKALEAHPAVAAALVSGELGPGRGQRVAATAVPVAEVDPDEDLADILESTVETALGPYKRPRRIEFVDELPNH